MKCAHIHVWINTIHSCFLCNRLGNELVERWCFIRDRYFDPDLLSIINSFTIISITNFIFRKLSSSKKVKFLLYDKRECTVVVFLHNNIIYFFKVFYFLLFMKTRKRWNESLTITEIFLSTWTMWKRKIFLKVFWCSCLLFLI